MSVVPKETIEVVAQSIGISNLSPEVALALTPDVEYRVREIMQVLLLKLPIGRFFENFMLNYIEAYQLRRCWRSFFFFFLLRLDTIRMYSGQF